MTNKQANKQCGPLGWQHNKQTC